VRKNCQFDDHASHGYGIQNFLAVEPRFGSKPELAESELRSLVNQAHRLGIYVIFDIVLHHAGDVFEYVIVGQEQAEAAWQDQPKFTVRWRDEHGVGNPQWTQPRPLHLSTQRSFPMSFAAMCWSLSEAMH